VKLLVIQPLDRHLVPVGGQLVAADAIHMAGPGELVYFVAAREAAEAMPNRFVPVDHAIVGIVDAVRSLASDTPVLPPASPAPPEPKVRRTTKAGPPTKAGSPRKARRTSRP
jgi:microcompartment protein CcmK/EutM